MLRALASLHDEHGDVAVAGLRREEWAGAAYAEEEFRELAEIVEGLPLLGTGGLGSRLWTGPAITVTGSTCRRSTGALNAVSPHARATINLRVHPSQDAVEAQDALVAAPRGAAAVRAGADGAARARPATASRPTRRARRTRRRGPRWRTAWGSPTVLVGHAAARSRW